MSNTLLAIQHEFERLSLISITVIFFAGCGYKAADSDDLQPRAGEIVGVLVDENGGAHPDAWIELYETTGTEPVFKHQGMDSDGRFGVFPPSTGIYNIIGSFGEPDTSTNKAIAQNIAFTAGGALNIGKMQAQKVALLTVHVSTPEGTSPEGVKVEVLGYGASTMTAEEGVGIVAIGIPAGTYQIRFSKSGFTPLVLDGLTLDAADATVLEDISLTIESEAANG